MSYCVAQTSNPLTKLLILVCALVGMSVSFQIAAAEEKEDEVNLIQLKYVNAHAALVIPKDYVGTTYSVESNGMLLESNPFKEARPQLARYVRAATRLSRKVCICLLVRNPVVMRNGGLSAVLRDITNIIRENRQEDSEVQLLIYLGSQHGLPLAGVSSISPKLAGLEAMNCADWDRKLEEAQ